MNAATSANQNPDNTLSRLKSGDDCAFNELVQSNWEKIYNRANGLLGNRQDAEEVAQDTFLRARKSLCNFRERLDISVGTVKSRLSRAREFLRIEFEKRS